MADQPTPTGNGTPILPLVILDLEQRQERSIPKYGTVLRAHNGRDALQDALEEAYDQVMYLRQLREEWPALVAKVRAAAFDQVVELLETFLHAEPPAGAVTNELDRIATYSNGTIRRAIAAVQGLQSQQPGELL